MVTARTGGTSDPSAEKKEKVWREKDLDKGKRGLLTSDDRIIRGRISRTFPRAKAFTELGSKRREGNG